MASMRTFSAGTKQQELQLPPNAKRTAKGVNTFKYWSWFTIHSLQFLFSNITLGVACSDINGGEKGVRIFYTLVIAVMTAAITLIWIFTRGTRKLAAPPIDIIFLLLWVPIYAAHTSRSVSSGCGSPFDWSKVSNGSDICSNSATFIIFSFLELVLWLVSAPYGAWMVRHKDKTLGYPPEPWWHVAQIHFDR